VENGISEQRQGLFAQTVDGPAAWRSFVPRGSRCGWNAHLGRTYRHNEVILHIMPTTQQAIGVRAVPRCATLQRFADQPATLALVDGTAW